MAISALNSTTSSEAISADANEFTVASTGSIAVGNYLVAMGTAGREFMKVQAIPVSGRVQVLRGVEGTRAVSHKSGVLLWIGAPDSFKSVSGTSPFGIGLTGGAGSLPDYALPGTVGFDGAGNMYVMVDLTFQVYDGITVVISKDGLFSASAVGTSSTGLVGVITEEASSSQWAWAQVYGLKSYAQFTSGSSLMTSTGIIQPASSASVPAGAVLGRTTSQASCDFGARIYGMFAASAVTTGTTAATSATGFSASVFLNHPYMERKRG